MSTLTLTAEPGTIPPRVKIEISTGSAATITALDLRRDGEPVRSLPSLGLSTVVIYDYEASYGVPVTYTAEVTKSVGSDSLSGSVTLSSDLLWLVHPRQPSLSFPVSNTGEVAFLTAIGSASSATQAARHRVIGASRDVIMSYGKRSDSSYSSFEIMATTESESRALASLLQDETPILVRFPASWDADFVEGFYAVETWSSSPVVDRSGNWYTRWALPLAPAVAPKVIVQADNSYAAGLLIGTYADSLAVQPTYYDRLVS